MLKKIILVFFVLLIIISSLPYYLSDVAKYAFFNKAINILAVVEGSPNQYPGVLKIALVRYNYEKKHIQIVFINENISILSKKSKTRTLKEMFFREAKANRIETLKKEILKLFKNTVDIDYYVYCDSDSSNYFFKLLNGSGINKILGESYFYYALKSQNRLNAAAIHIKLIKYAILNFNRNFTQVAVKFLKNKNINIQTDFKRFDLIWIMRALKNINIKKDVFFIDFPTVIKRNRTEPADENIHKMAEIFKGVPSDISKNKISIKVLNCSNKNRLAEKAVNVLRKNSFNVFYWGNETQKNRFTIVLDRINNPDRANEITDILKCGEILIGTDPQPFANMTILLGNDCILYDKLDKIN